MAGTRLPMRRLALPNLAPLREITTTPLLTSRRPRAVAINNLGTVVGRYRLAGIVHGFIYHNGQYTSLDVPGATGTWPQGINDQGQIVGTMYDSTGNPHGFSYLAGVFKTIDFPGALFTAVSAINNAGTIVGQYTDAVQPLF